MMKSMFASTGMSQENTMKPPNALNKNISSVALASTGTNEYVRTSNTSYIQKRNAIKNNAPIKTNINGNKNLINLSGNYAQNNLDTFRDNSMGSNLATASNSLIQTPGTPNWNPALTNL